MMGSTSKHWLVLRFAALPLVPLAVYFATQLEHIASADRLAFISWLQEPTPAVTVPIFLACAFYHACLGMQEIIEDYARDGAKHTLFLLNTAFFAALAALSALALYKVYAQ